MVVADDDEFTRALVKTIFKPKFEVDEVINGKELVVKAQQNKPDLIITDIVMPVLSGYRAISRLSKEPYFKRTAVIFMSGMVGDRDIYEMYKPDNVVTGFITKPFSKADITALAKKLMEKT